MTTIEEKFNTLMHLLNKMEQCIKNSNELHHKKEITQDDEEAMEYYRGQYDAYNEIYQLLKEKF